jgi:hypothetical protein
VIRTRQLWRIAHIIWIGALLFAGVKTAAAQEVVGISEILSSTTSSEVYTWSETDVDPAVAVYYSAYVEGYLYENKHLRHRYIQCRRTYGKSDAHRKYAYGWIVRSGTLGSKRSQARDDWHTRARRSGWNRIH